MAANLTLFFYVASMAFGLLYGGFRKRALFLICAFSMAAGFVAQTLDLAARWSERSIIPATNLNEICEATSWGLVAIFLFAGYLLKNRVFVFFLTPLVVFFQMAARIIPLVPKEPKPFYFTPWFSLHITLLIIGIGFFLYSFIYSSIFIMQDHSLRHHRQPIALKLPSLEESVRWATRFLVAGYVLYTAGLLSSAVYGVIHGAKDRWHPGLLEAASLAVWLILGFAIYGWATAKLNPRKRSWLVIAGAASTLFIILGILWH